MAVRVKNLFLGRLNASGEYEVYECPAGKAAGFALLHAKGKAGGPFSIMVSIRRGLVDVELLPDGITCQQGQVTRDFNLRQPLEAGDKLVVTLGDGADCQISLGGFEQDV